LRIKRERALDLRRAVSESIVIELAEKINNSDLNDLSFLEEVLKTDTPEVLVNFLKEENYQYENAMLKVSRALTNIAAGEGKAVPRLVELGIIKKAVDLVQHESFEISGNAFAILANIAGQSLEDRDQILYDEGMENISQSLLSKESKRGSKEPFEEDLTWFLSVLFRGRPYPDFSLVDILSSFETFIFLADPLFPNSTGYFIQFSMPRGYQGLFGVLVFLC